MAPFFKLSLQDLVKGAFMAAVSAMLTTLIALIQNQGLTLTPENMQVIAGAALVSALTYIMKQLATDEDGRLMGKI